MAGEVERPGEGDDAQAAEQLLTTVWPWVTISRTNMTSGYAVDVDAVVRCASLTQTLDGSHKTVIDPSFGLGFMDRLKPATYR